MKNPNKATTDNSPKISAAIQNASDVWNAPGDTYQDLSRRIKDSEDGLLKADKAMKSFLAKLTK